MMTGSYRKSVPVLCGVPLYRTFYLPEQSFMLFMVRSQFPGGYAINIMAQADTFQVEGEAHVAVRDNWIDDDERPGEPKKSSGRGYDCHDSGSALWVSDPAWLRRIAG